MKTNLWALAAAALLSALVCACAPETEQTSLAGVSELSAAPASGEAGSGPQEAVPSAPPEESRAFTLIFTPGEHLLSKSIKGRGGDPPYSIYSYGGEIEVLLGEERVPLAQALEEKRVTMDEILAKAAADVDSGAAEGELYKDGGSQVYRYPDYAILKFHTLSGKEDVYIGRRDISLSSFY